MLWGYLSKGVGVLAVVLISTAFYTLVERKVLSYIQIRKGPNKLGYKGVLQPFSDAIKLFVKEPTFLNASNWGPYIISPAVSLGLTLIVWLSFPSTFGDMGISLSIAFILCCLSAGVYPVLAAGWSSNSKYALLGGLRAVAQTISYEVSLAVILLGFILLASSLHAKSFLNLEGQWLLLLSPPMAGVWFISSLAETNRTPFDFSEGESELVSGFNTEYSGGSFALFFMAEYGSMLFMSALYTFLFLAPSSASLFLPVKMTLTAILFVWVRGGLPRLRYDKLMTLAWKIFLPVSLLYLTFFFGVKTLILPSVMLYSNF